MNAREFYELFKDALGYIGVRFNEMENAAIKFVDGGFEITSEGRTFKFTLREHS